MSAMPTPTIAVITRTKNRPLLLERCAQSLLKQTFKDFVWTIVNDNGAVSEVESIASSARNRGLHVQVFHRTENKGIGAAANHGVVRSQSEFIHIHDDDDTLEPGFYESTTQFLASKSHYGGVVTCTNRIDERIDESSTILTIKKCKFNDLTGAIYISDLLCQNQFPPISFIYRRSAFDAIGAYDETIPVLEDWDFNLRFIRDFDIGVIKSHLANYHWRVGINTGGTAQTMTSGASLHEEYTALVRNRMLRKDIDSNTMGLGSLTVLGRNQQLQMLGLKLLNDRAESQLWIRRFIKKLIRRK